MIRALALAAACLLLAGCGARPQRAVGVSQGPTVHYLLCEGDAVNTVELTAPDGRVLWRIHSDRGSSRTAYRVGETPPGFRQTAAFGGLAATTRVSGPDGKPTMSFSPGEVPATGILRGDGRRVSAGAFRAGRSDYCGSAGQDRAAAIAVGFAALVLLAVLAQRWLQGRARPKHERVRDPWSRPWKR